MSFSLWGLECKSRKSRNTWSNRQIWPWNTEWSRAKLIEFCQENALVMANTLFQQQEKTLPMDITRWSTLKSEWLYSLQPKMEKLYTGSKSKIYTVWSCLWLRSSASYCKIQAWTEESRENYQAIQADLNQISMIIQWKWQIDSRH